VEAIGLGGAIGATAWAAVGELLPVLPKAVGGVVLGVLGIWGASKALAGKLREKRNRSGH